MCELNPYHVQLTANEPNKSEIQEMDYHFIPASEESSDWESEPPVSEGEEKEVITDQPERRKANARSQMVILHPLADVQCE